MYKYSYIEEQMEGKKPREKVVYNPSGKTTHIVEVKKHGKIYVYEQYSYYDKNTKQARPKQLYLGVKDAVSGQVRKARDPVVKAIPVKKDRCYGASFVFERIIAETKLYETVKEAFGDITDDMMAVALALACQGSKLYLVEQWLAMNHCRYSRRNLSSPRISELLKEITFDKRNRFFMGWIKGVKEDEYLAYDITSVSCYARSIEHVELGYNRDKESLPQINLGLLYGEQSRIPLYYQMFNGSIKDVGTIENMLIALRSYGCAAHCKFVMDKGFFSTVNVGFFMQNGHKFAISMPFTMNLAKETVDSNDDICSPQYYSALHECYCKRTDCAFEGMNLAAHLYFNMDKKSAWDKELNKKIHKNRQALALLKRQQETPGLKKYTDEEFGHIVTQHKAFFTVKKSKITITDNNGLDVRCSTIEFDTDLDAFKDAMKTKGYMIILTNDFDRQSEEMLSLYRDKEVVENAFDDIKNQLDMDRLNVQSNESLQGKLFLVFLSLILVSAMRNALRKTGLSKNISYPEAIMELTKIKLYTYENNQMTLSKPSAKQKKILAALSLTEEDLRVILKGKEMISTI
jgi:transposase